MSYTPTQWSTGDTITAEKLNKFEEGVTALSNYDLEIHLFYEEDVQILTAQGLSPSELYAKYPNVKAILFYDDGEELLYHANSIFVRKDTDAEAILFGFFLSNYQDPNRTLEISLNGYASYTSIGTYTYSDGQYTFEDCNK